MARPNLTTLCMLFSLPIVGAVLFAPALARLVEVYEVSTRVSQLTIVVYLAGYAIGQLVYGWIASRLGRKKTIGIGLIIFMLGAVLSAQTDGFGWLIIGRGVMALGAAVGLVMALSIISDHFDEKEARKVLAQVSLTLAFAPGLSNMVGGILVGYLGWESSLYFLAGYGLVMLLLVSRMEIAPCQSRKAVFRAYLQTVKKGRFVMLAIVASLTSAVVYVFASVAPLTAIHILETAPQLYGVMSLVPLVGTVSGCLLTAKFSDRVSARGAIGIGLLISCFGVFIKWGCIHFGGLHLWSMFVPMPLIYFGMAAIYPNAIALALRLCVDTSAGPSLFGAFNAGMSLLSVFVVGHIPLEHMSFTFIGIFGLMLCLFMLENVLHARSLRGSELSD